MPELFFETLPFDEWPCDDADLFNERIETACGGLKFWAQATRRQLLYTWGLHLGYLKSVSPESLKADLSTRLSPHLLDGYITALATTFTDLSIATHLHHLYMASNRLDPAADWDYLRRKRAEYLRKGRPALDLNAPKTATELMQLGYELMNEADELARQPDAKGRCRNQPNKDEASLYLDGLMIAMLAGFLWRKRNLADRVLEGNKPNSFPAGIGFMFDLAATTTKTIHAASYSASVHLAARLHSYIATYRPVLLDGKQCDGLLISQRGTQLAAMTIYKRICKRTGARYGTHHVHLRAFRRAGLTQFAADLPAMANYMKAYGVHASDRVEDDHYNFGGSLAASSRMQDALARFR